MGVIILGGIECNEGDGEDPNCSNDIYNTSVPDHLVSLIELLINTL